MAKVLYTAHAHVVGGREGHARTADSELELNLRTPKEIGGAGGGTNPEELFVVGYAASFGSTLGVLARRRRLDAGEITIDSAMSLLPTADGSFQLVATLDVALPGNRGSGSCHTARTTSASAVPVLQCDPQHRRRDSARRQVGQQ
jgi:Ohr subfamily peroxiredoxin